MFVSVGDVFVGSGVIFAVDLDNVSGVGYKERMLVFLLL